MIQYWTIRKCSGTTYEMEVRAINFHLLLILAKRKAHVLNCKIFHAQSYICLRQIYYQAMVFSHCHVYQMFQILFTCGLIFLNANFLLYVRVKMSNTKINNDVQFVLICVVLFCTLLYSTFACTWLESWFFYMHVNALYNNLL